MQCKSWFRFSAVSMGFLNMLPVLSLKLQLIKLTAHYPPDANSASTPSDLFLFVRLIKALITAFCVNFTAGVQFPGPQFH